MHLLFKMHFPKFANMRLYDAKAKGINLQKIQPDFYKLAQDPYVPEGFRRKHIIRVQHTGPKGAQFTLAPNAPLFQSSVINPTHGNISRVYPEYDPQYPDEFMKLVAMFCEKAEVPAGETMLIQAQRITCSLEKGAGLPSVEGWHRDGVTKIGIMCVDRQGIKGGVNQFRANDKKEIVLSVALNVGTMVIFEDDKVEHRVTPIEVADNATNGFRDVMLFAYPTDTMA